MAGRVYRQPAPLQCYTPDALVAINEVASPWQSPTAPDMLPQNMPTINTSHFLTAAAACQTAQSLRLAEATDWTTTEKLEMILRLSAEGLGRKMYAVPCLSSCHMLKWSCDILQSSRCCFGHVRSEMHYVRNETHCSASTTASTKLAHL